MGKPLEFTLFGLGNLKNNYMKAKGKLLSQEFLAREMGDSVIPGALPPQRCHRPPPPTHEPSGPGVTHRACPCGAT